MATRRFITFGPDIANGLSTRLVSRPKHLEQNAVSKSTGIQEQGAIMLSEDHPVVPEGTPQPMCGSYQIVNFQTIDQVWDHLKKDAYWNGGVWDKTRLAAYPLGPAPATTTPLPPLKDGYRRYLAYCPDLPNGLPQRLKMRPGHAEDFHKSREAGNIEQASSILSPTEEAVEGQPLPMVGSYLILLYPNLSGAWDRIKADKYWTGAVWDQQKTCIWPILGAVPSIVRPDV